MLELDLALLLIYACLTLASRDLVTANTLTGNLSLQLVFDFIFIHLGLYNYVDSLWFFIVKGYILFASICYLYIMNGSKWVAILLFFNMLYLYGLWVERAFTTVSQPFHSYHQQVMVTIMVIELLYLFGVSGFYGGYRNDRFSFNSRFRSGGGFSFIPNGAAK